MVGDSTVVVLDIDVRSKGLIGIVVAAEVGIAVVVVVVAVPVVVGIGCSSSMVGKTEMSVVDTGSKFIAVEEHSVIIAMLQGKCKRICKQLENFFFFFRYTI